MSFADELFGNGQVKPLKLPPRMILSELSLPSPSRTPRSASGGLKLASRQMWMEPAVSDSFQKAAEELREGTISGERAECGSGSPLGGVHQWTINDLNMSDDFSHIEQESGSCAWNETMISNRIEEPRGLAIARKLMPLSVDQGKDTIIQVHKQLSPVKESKNRLQGQLYKWKGSMKCGGMASENELKRRETEIKTVAQYMSRPKMLLLCIGFQNAC